MNIKANIHEDYQNSQLPKKETQSACFLQPFPSQDEIWDHIDKYPENEVQFYKAILEKWPKKEQHQHPIDEMYQLESQIGSIQHDETITNGNQANNSSIKIDEKSINKIFCAKDIILKTNKNMKKTINRLFITYAKKCIEEDQLTHQEKMKLRSHFIKLKKKYKDPEIQKRKNVNNNMAATGQVFGQQLGKNISFTLRRAASKIFRQKSLNYLSESSQMKDSSKKDHLFRLKFHIMRCVNPSLIQRTQIPQTEYHK